MADFLLSVGVDTTLSYNQLIKDIGGKGGLIERLSANLPKIKISLDIDQASVTQLQTQIDAIINKLNSVPAVTSSGAGNPSVGSQATSAANTPKVLSQGTKEYYDALKRVNTLITQVTNNQKKWSAAKDGASSESYAKLTYYLNELNALYAQVETEKLAPDDFKKKFSVIASGIANANRQIKEAGENTQTWGQRVGGLAKKFGEWFSLTRVIMAAYRAVRQMVTAVIELDTAMTELKKVTNETDATYEKFLDNAAKRAKSLGADLTETVSATADFARLGYGIEDAEKLADTALVYKNVAEGINDIDTASSHIIATMQAFGVPAEDAMSIVDKFNKVGNEYAISADGVGEVMLRSAAAMSAANNTLDETIALSAAANTIVQDPEKVGTTLKTISMYLRAAKTEAEEAGESTEGMAGSVSALRDELLSLTGNQVDIQLDDDTFKSTYQIMKELSGVWDDLTDVSQANITELIGGKRNANVVSALLENFKIAEDAMEASANSAGSALEENAKQIESIQGKLNKMLTEFKTLAENFIGSEFVKWVVDFATNILSVLNNITTFINKLGGLKTVLFAVTSALLLAKGGLIALKVADTISAALKGLKTGFSTFIHIIPDAIAAWRAYASGVVSANTAMQASIPVIGLVLAGITTLIAVLSAAKKSGDDTSEEIDDTSEKLQQLAQEAAQSSDNIIDLTLSYLEASNALNTLTGTMESYTNARQDLIDGLQIEQTELQKLIDKYGDYDKALAAAAVTKLKEELVDLRGGLDDVGESFVHNRKSPVIGTYGTNAGIITEGNPDIEDQLLEALDALAKSESFGGGLGIVGGKVSMTDIDGTSTQQGYILYPNDPSDADKAAYGDTAARVLHEYDVFKAALTSLAEAGFDSENILYKSIYDNYSKIKDDVEKFIELRDKINSNLASQAVFNAVAQGGLPQTQQEFDVWRQGLIDTAYASGQFSGTLDVVTDSIDKVLKQQPRFEGFYDNVTSSVSDAYGAQKEFVKSTSSVQSLGSGFDKLSKIYEDVLNEGDFDWGSILNNQEFENAFGGLGGAYYDFIQTISESPSDIGACQEAFNNLAGAYLANSIALRSVTDESRDAVVAILKQKGVANAAAIVDAQLAYNKEKLKYATAEYADMEYEQVYKMYAACEAGSLEQQVLAELAIAKMLVNENGIKTEGDIQQLLNLATVANATTASLANVASAGKLLAQADAAESKAKEYKHLYDSAKTGAYGKEWKEYEAEAEALREQAEALLNKPMEFNQPDIEFVGTDETAEKKQETWFEKQLAEHQHSLAMEKESQAEYLAWLSQAYPRAYNEGIIELNDFYKYQEEVFKGLRDVFKDHLGDIEHEISMRESYEGESDYIIALYEKLMKDVEKELSSARAQGLDDTSDYVQELQKKWQGYYDSVKDMREEAESEAKDAIKELVDYRIDMIKQEIEDEKDALDKKLDNLKEFYDKQKEMLQDKYDEEKYLEEQAEKRKSVSDLQAELAMLENDDSAWAQKRKLELREELATAQDDLGKFEDEHALDMALDALEDAYDAQEAQIQAEMDALSDVLNDKEALFNRALADIKSNTYNLYQEMLAYNRKYGTGNDEDVKDIYEEAYKALLEYKDIYGKDYDGVVLTNATNYKPDTGSWNDSKISGANVGAGVVSGATGLANQALAPSLTAGSTVTVKKSATHFGSKSGSKKMASSVPGGSYTVYQTSGDQVLIGRNGVYTGWIKKSDIVGYARGTSSATSGLHSIDELGSEYLFTSSDGTNYRVLNSGDKVLNAKATEFLYEFANGGGDILEKIIKSAFGTSLYDHIQPTVIHNDIKVGGVTVAGNADTRTVSEIRRAQRDNLTEMLKSLNKLNK